MKIFAEALSILNKRRNTARLKIQRKRQRFCKMCNKQSTTQIIVLGIDKMKIITDLRCISAMKDATLCCRFA